MEPNSYNNFTDVKDFIDWVQKQKRFSKKVSLEKMHYYCSLFGNPYNKFKSIHVTGTNGKGSVIAFLRSILMEAGFNVATFTSPYITYFNERIEINNKFISDDDLLKYGNMIIDKYPIIINSGYETPSFFEFITLLAFIYFSNQNIDFAIIEVGIGGLLDSTNVINSELSVITNVSLDHMNVLGNSLEEITLQKLGISRPNHYLISGIKEKSLQDLTKSYCEKNSTKLILSSVRAFEIKYSDIYQTEFLLEGYDEPFVIKLVGNHQVENAITSIVTIEALCKINSDLTDKLKLSLRKGLLNTTWPGRLEIVHHDPLILIDGAHNIDGITRICEFIKGLDYNKKRAIVSISKDKEKKEMINLLDNVFDEIIFTEYSYGRSSKAQELYDISNNHNKSIMYSLNEIIDYLNTNKYDFNIFIGSLYLVCDIKNLIKK